MNLDEFSSQRPLFLHSIALISTWDSDGGHCSSCVRGHSGAHALGWVTQREGRLREARAQTARLVDSLRDAHGDAPVQPLLGSAEAHKLLVQWVPREVELRFPLPR